VGGVFRIVHALVSDRAGGLERAYANMTWALGALGHAVEAWVPPGAGYVPDGVPRWDFAPRGHYDLLAAWRARRRLVARRPDLIITHAPRATGALALARTGLGVPHLACAHSYKAKRMRGAGAVVVLTEHMRAHYAAVGFARLHVVPNMLWDFPAQTLPPRPPDGVVRLGFMGRADAPEKGLDVLLQALETLGPGYALAVAGGQGQNSATVRYDGWVSDIRAWLAGVDVLVVPSTHETFGIAVLEAMAHGRPVVACEVSGPAAQIEHGVTGWLAPPGDAGALAGRIREAVAARAYWPQIVAAAHCAAGRFDAQRVMPALGRIVEEVARR
jgi:glycosyltransferase involved in cell wall biosynthesis